MTLTLSGNKRGSALVEVVVTASIIAAVSLAFFGAFAALSRFHARNMLSIKGGLLAEEGIEVVRLMKDGGWSNLTAIPLDAPNYLSVSSTTWSATTTPEVIDGTFYRTFRLHSVSRNASDDIVSSGGTLDPNTLLVESSVAWDWRGATSTITYEAYVTNI